MGSNHPKYTKNRTMWKDIQTSRQSESQLSSFRWLPPVISWAPISTSRHKSKSWQPALNQDIVLDLKQLRVGKKATLGMCVLVAQSCPTHWNPIHCSLPGSCVHRILQAKTLEWVVMPYSRRSSQPRDWTQVACITGRFFTIWATREALISTGVGQLVEWPVKIGKQKTQCKKIDRSAEGQQWQVPDTHNSILGLSTTLRMRGPKYWSFSFSISPSKEIPGLIFRMDWLDLLAVQGTLKSLLQHHSSKASILWCLTGQI